MDQNELCWTLSLHYLCSSQNANGMDSKQIHTKHRYTLDIVSEFSSIVNIKIHYIFLFFYKFFVFHKSSCITERLIWFCSHINPKEKQNSHLWHVQITCFFCCFLDSILWSRRARRPSSHWSYSHFINSFN